MVSNVHGIKGVMTLFLFGLTCLSETVSAIQSNEEEETLYENRIEMAPMSLSLFEGQRVAARFNIKLMIQVASDMDPESIKQRLPQLRADFLTALSHLSKARFKVNEPLDPGLIKTYLTAFADKRIGEGKLEIFVLEAYVDAR